MEGWVVHLADHDWVISSSACKWSVEALKTLASEVYGVKDEKTFNAVRNYVLANLTAMRLYGILSSRGRKASPRKWAASSRRKPLLRCVPERNGSAFCGRAVSS